MPRKANAASYPTDMPFSDMPTLAVERLANALSRHGDLVYMRLFGLHLSECRVLAIVLSREPTSLGEVCEQIELDKGHASRLVTRLVSAGLLERHADTADQRSAYLVLTPAGREIALGVRAAGAARNREWMAALNDRERAGFMAALAKMTAQARTILAEELQSSGGGAAPPLPTARELGAKGAGPKSAKSLVVERGALEELRRQLDQLLGGARP